MRRSMGALIDEKCDRIMLLKKWIRQLEASTEQVDRGTQMSGSLKYRELAQRVIGEVSPRVIIMEGMSHSGARALTVP